ncbi:MAG: GNAT family N-acetyltransferase [Actinomycetota bacterium]|nr:GNAT family N-acetyltransferase [Actinomycetota bacterium]
MTTRPASEDDEPILRELWQEFAERVPPAPWGMETWDEVWPDVERHIRRGVAVIAEEDGRPIGFVLAELGEVHKGAARVTDLYVRDDARRRGLAKALLGEVAARARERGLPYVALEVATANREASAVYDRLGFQEWERALAIETEALEQRVRRSEAPPSFGSIHVQSDDEPAVRRAVEHFVPRMGRTDGSEVTPARNGWVTVYDALCDGDRDAQRRLARELSDRLGTVVVALALEQGAVVRFLLFERGRIVDEYLSLPEYYGPLKRADALTLAANPPLVGRLTGAEPAQIRAVMRNASSPAELPPPAEHLAQIGEVLGLSGAARGYEEPGR